MTEDENHPLAKRTKCYQLRRGKLPESRIPTRIDIALREKIRHRWIEFVVVVWQRGNKISQVPASFRSHVTDLSHGMTNNLHVVAAERGESL